MLSILIFILFLNVIYAEKLQLNNSSTIRLIEKWNYPVERHQVETEDGYLLGLFRIPFGYGEQNKRSKGPVLIFHGLFCSSDTWVVQQPDNSLGFVLADAGYDVWLANCRGNTHSRKHKTLSVTNSQFWNYDFHEIGYYDLPAFIDYILNITNENDLYYIGHSMGTLITYILGSTRPEYNKKFRVGIHLAPVAFFSIDDSLQRLILDTAGHFNSAMKSKGIYEVLPVKNGLYSILWNFFCSDQSSTRLVCNEAFSFIIGVDLTQYNKSFVPNLLNYFPAGTSVQTVEHFLQLFQTGKFQHRDLGVKDNLIKFNQEYPLEYDVTKVTAPISLHYSDDDVYAKPKGVKKLAQLLPNVIGLHKIPITNFKHSDFLWSNKAQKLVFEPILDIFNKY